MPLKMVLVAALGCLFCLDRACPQFMICRPIVVAPFIGWVLGDVMTGLVIGPFWS
jgi:mannose/fructose/N-acetylgalactosamine-specific phosphotransferase system component IIC